MGWLEKGLLLLPCVAPSARLKVHGQPSHQIHESSVTNPWHQQRDIVSLVLARLPTADVLAVERVCKAWRQCRISLASDVCIVASKKAYKSQQTWLSHNFDRLAGRLSVSAGGTAGSAEERTTTKDTATPTRSQTANRHANGLMVLALKCCNVNSLLLHNCSSITKLPADSFEALQRLQQLHISSCSDLAALPESIGHLSSLRLLSIESCDQLRTLPCSIGRLKTLQRLMILRCGQLDLIPSSLGQLCSVEEMLLHDCMQLQQLPGTLGGLGSLQLLDVQRCGLTAFPGSVGQLVMKDLRIVSCPHLQELPDSMSQLHLLQHLHLDLPLHLLPSISHLTSLKRLCISHVTEEVTTITHQIGQLINLESLTLIGWPGLHQLPEGLGELPLLSQLVLRDCGQLMELPESLGRLKALKRLVLQGCGLITLPDSLGSLDSLTSLLIHSCDVRDLPGSIGQLTSLQQFILVDCPRLRHIPGSFGSLGQQKQHHQLEAHTAHSSSNHVDGNATGCCSSSGSDVSENATVTCSSSSRSHSKGFSVTISGCERLQMPISMSHLRRNITPGHLAAVVAEQALQDSW